MALTVETGTGSATADAFISLADADTYHTNHGNSTWTGTDELKEQAIRRATAYLSNSVDWVGARANLRSQALAWPRSSTYDCDGTLILTTEIPIEVVNAAAELALREIVTPGSLTPDVTLTERVKMEKIGDLQTTYADTPISADSSKPIISMVEDMIACFVVGGGGETVFVNRA